MGWLPQVKAPARYDATWMQKLVESVRTAINFSDIMPGGSKIISGTYLQVNGSYSQYRMAIQDGSGRITEYWNADRVNSVDYYHTTGEDAFKFVRSVTVPLQVYYAVAGTAGGVITWVPLVYLTFTGEFGLGTALPTSKLHVVGLPVYSNNAAAIAGGLTAGAFYRNGADPDGVCVVH